MDSLSNDEVNSIIEKVTKSSNPQEVSFCDFIYRLSSYNIQLMH